MTLGQGTVKAAEAGGLDTSFDPGDGPSFALSPLVPTTIYSILPLSDGRVFAAGSWDRWNGQVNPGIVLLHTNGAVDTSFSPNPTNALPAGVRAVALYPGNQLVVSGQTRIARVRFDGSDDLTFSNINYTAQQVWVQNDGKILVSSEQNGGFSLGRLDATGAWDTNFARGNRFFGGFVRHTLLQPDGRIVVFGKPTYEEGGQTRDFGPNRILRLNSDGSLDTSFVPNIFPTDLQEIFQTAATLQPDGRILIGLGLASSSGMLYGSTSNRSGLLRLNANGSVDTSFQPGDGVCQKFSLAGTLLTFCGDVFSYLPDGNGRLYVGGVFSVFNNIGRTNFARISTNGTLDTTFNPTTAWPNGNVRLIENAGGGKLYLGGDFKKVGSVTRPGLARLFQSAPPPPDATKPTLTITYPPGAFFISPSNTLNLAGTAADAGGLRLVSVKVDDGSFDPASGTTQWTAAINLAVGTNVVQVKAVDLSGNESIARLVVLHRVESRLTVRTNGVGSIVPAVDGMVFEIGRNITLTAKPGKGWLFSNWVASSGQIIATPGLNIPMQSNLVVTANFVTNTYASLKGTYQGLVLDPAAPSHARGGFASLTLLDSGKFSGYLIVNGIRLPISGVFDLARSVTIPVSVKPGMAAMTLALSVVDSPSTMAGTLTDTLGSIPVTLYRSPFSKAFPATSAAGNFNALIQPNTNHPLVIGDGFGNLKIDPTGGVAFGGSLGDGTPFSLKTVLSESGSFPMYVLLAGGRGSVLGWLTVDPLAPDVLVATNGLWWTRLGAAKNAGLYPAGFTNEFVTLASPYTAPVNSRVLSVTNGVVILSGDDLIEARTNEFVLGADNKVTSTNGVAAVIARPTGSFSGAVAPPRPGPGMKSTAIRGVLLQRQNFGGGYFLGTNRTGQVYFGP